MICSGAQLEIGWLPNLLSKANNPRVLPGNPGHIVASYHVLRLDIPQEIDRSQGDVHPEGNPHIQGDPRNIKLVANELTRRMAQLDTANAEIYRENLNQFIQRWDQAILEWEHRAAPLKGKQIITHHKSWPYLFNWLGLEEVANLEPIPGIPPSVSFLSSLAARFKEGGADYIVRTPYQNAKSSEWLSQRSGIPMLVLPLTVGGTDEAQDLFSLFDDIITRLLEARK